MGRTFAGAVTDPVAPTEAAVQADMIRIGTRGSPLALAQAHEVRRRLAEAHGRAPETFEIRIIKTSGDRIQDRPLSEVGGKGLFTKEIEDALLDGTIDLAVHSMKDMPTVLPDGLVMSATLPREDVRDALISPRWKSIADLPKGAKVGTSSLRRQAQLLNRRPDLEIVQYRGNVETRLRRLDDGAVDATLLACAGLRRLGLFERVDAPIAIDDMLPAVAQGAVGIEIRDGDARVAALVAPIDHAESAICVAAERAYLRRLDGSCRTPIAGLATLDGATLTVRGEILRPDGSEAHADSVTGPAADAEQLGTTLAETLLAAASPGFLAGGA